MKSKARKTLLGLMVLGLVFAGLAPSLTAEAAVKPRVMTKSGVIVKPAPRLKPFVPATEPDPIYLLVRWGNLDGQAPTDAPNPINYNGTIKMTSGKGQLRLAKTYRYEFIEDGFIQRTGQEIDVISRIHGHKDGVVIRVGNYDLDENNWLNVGFGGDIRTVSMIRLKDLIEMGGSKFPVKVDGKDYGQSVEIRVLK